MPYARNCEVGRRCPTFWCSRTSNGRQSRQNGRHTMRYGTAAGVEMSLDAAH